MSFYITLPSNSSQFDFPDNTLTHYTTRLKNSLRLNGNYEVALAQIIFPKNWKYRKDGLVTITTPESTSRIPIKFLARESLQEFFKNLKQSFLLSGVAVEIAYDHNTSKIFLMVPPECSIKFEDGLNEYFGFKNSYYEATEENQVFPSDKIVGSDINFIQSLFIYLDICEYQLVGDTEAPLLQVVSTNNANENYFEKIYDSPHYVPLSRNNLETIEVDIRSDLGEPIQFQSGKVVVKLHFRKIGYF